MCYNGRREPVVSVCTLSNTPEGAVITLLSAFPGNLARVPSPPLSVMFIPSPGVPSSLLFSLLTIVSNIPCESQGIYALTPPLDHP